MFSIPIEGAGEIMYSVLRRILSGALIALVFAGMLFQAAAAEAQPASRKALSPQTVHGAQPQADASASEPTFVETASEEPAAVESLIEAPSEHEVTVGLEAIDQTELVDNPDAQVPLAGGEPRVSVRANRDIRALAIGDSLVLTCELSGFGGLEYAIRWQACVNGQWMDLPGENSDTLVIQITSENADWAYRAAVDAQPV